MIETLTKKNECTGVSEGYMGLSFRAEKKAATHLLLLMKPAGKCAQARRVTLSKDEVQNIVDYAIHCGLATPTRGGRA